MNRYGNLSKLLPRVLHHTHKAKAIKFEAIYDPAENYWEMMSHTKQKGRNFLRIEGGVLFC